MKANKVTLLRVRPPTLVLEQLNIGDCFTFPTGTEVLMVTDGGQTTSYRCVDLRTGRSRMLNMSTTIVTLVRIDVEAHVVPPTPPDVVAPSS